MTHNEIVAEIAKEITEDAKTITEDIAEAEHAAAAGVETVVSKVAAEITKENPNWIKITILLLALVLSLAGSGVGIWASVHKS